VAKKETAAVTGREKGVDMAMGNRHHLGQQKWQGMEKMMVIPGGN